MIQRFDTHAGLVEVVRNGSKLGSVKIIPRHDVKVMSRRESAQRRIEDLRRRKLALQREIFELEAAIRKERRRI